MSTETQAEVKRAQAASAYSHLTAAARAVTRPIITIILTGVIAQVVIEGITPPDWFIYGIAMPCILSWFGDRTIQHWRQRNSSPSTGED